MDQDDLLPALDAAVAEPALARHLATVVPTLELRLRLDRAATMAWEPIPLELYGELPPGIRSSWVFVLRAGTTTGAERHPNSHQRMVSYRGSGDFPVQRGGQWESRRLTSDRARDLSERWVSIPPYTWHQGIVDPGENWVVVSFHTVDAEALIEERPGDDDAVRQRLYVGPDAGQ
jgi:hypothetical protein